MKIYDQGTEFENDITQELPVYHVDAPVALLPAHAESVYDDIDYYDYDDSEYDYEDELPTPRYSRVKTYSGPLIAAASVLLAGGAVAAGMNDNESPEVVAAEADTAPVVIPDVDCREMNLELPLSLDADVAKEAVANIEFFFDDPGMTEQAREAISAAQSEAEVQGIIQNIFSSRGISVNFGLAPDADWLENAPLISLENYKISMANMVRAYSTLPRALAVYSSEILLSNGITRDEEIVDGLAFSQANRTVYNQNAFLNYDWGVNIVWHESVHHLDHETCTADASVNDRLFEALHNNSNDYLESLPEELREARHNNVFASEYGSTKVVEDKADTVAYMTRNYLDVSDASFEDSNLLHQRQQIMMRRLAEELNMPEIPQLFQFFDIYGTMEHPKQIVAEDLSPYSVSYGEMYAGTDMLYSAFLTDTITDTFRIRNIDGNNFAMRTEIKIPAGEYEYCAENPEVRELIDLNRTLIELNTHNGLGISTYVVPSGIDSIDGKLICTIDTYGAGLTQ